MRQNATPKCENYLPCAIDAGYALHTVAVDTITRQKNQNVHAKRMSGLVMHRAYCTQTSAQKRYVMRDETMLTKVEEDKKKEEERRTKRENVVDTSK